jgi:hypothetical protein
MYVRTCGSYRYVRGHLLVMCKLLYTLTVMFVWLAGGGTAFASGEPDRQPAFRTGKCCVDHGRVDAIKRPGEES